MKADQEDMGKKVCRGTPVIFFTLPFDDSYYHMLLYVMMLSGILSSPLNSQGDRDYSKGAEVGKRHKEVS